MAMRCERILIAAIPFAALIGCATADQPIGSADPGFGETVKYNAAVQTINPAPVYLPGSAQPGDNGAKGTAAVKRYRTDEVKPVETMETTSGSDGGSSSSSSGPPR